MDAPERIEVVAHRGASAEVPEHTAAAYRRAIADGADALECDVRLTADGHLVCVHDRRVDRTSNGRGAVSGLELAELAELDFASWKEAERRRSGRKKQSHNRHPGSHPPQTGLPDPQERGLPAGFPDPQERRRLTGPLDPQELGSPADLSAPDLDDPSATEALRLTPLAAATAEVPDRDETSVLTLDRLLDIIAEAPRPVGLAIETKHPTRWGGRVEERLIDLLRARGLDRPGRDPSAGEVRVMSFSSRSLARVHEAAPGLPTVYLLQFLVRRQREGRLPPGVSIAGPSVRIVRKYPEYVRRLRSAGGRVHVWTVDAPADVELCAGLGVDAVITNRPAQVLAQLGRGDAVAR